MLAIIIKIIKQMKNDKRALAFIILAPILILSFIYLIFSEPNYNPEIAVTDMPDQIVSELQKEFKFVWQIKESTDIILQDKNISAVLYMEDGKMALKMHEPDGTKTKIITKKVTNALQSAGSSAQGLNISFLYGDAEQGVFDRLGYAFLGIFSFAFMFLIVGISFIKERLHGTMERFILAPISRYSVAAGFMFGFGVFAAIQSILVAFYAKYVLRLAIAGSFWNVVLLMLLLSFAAIVLAAAVSLFAKNEFRIIQFIPIIIVPQFFFSGIIPVDTLPYNLDKLAYFMPVYYACEGLREVMVKGVGFSQLMFYYNGLVLFILVLFLINVLLLRKYRTV